MDNPIYFSTKAFLLFLIMAAASLGCTSEKRPTPIEDTNSHTSQNSLDVTGTYVGITPCASCEGIETKIEISDSTYKLTMIYLGEEEPNQIKKTGRYSWNKTGNQITLENNEPPNQYFVGENVLIHLDQNGDRITGNLSDKYRLKKQR
ncbi:copper resistance protein NlpE [Gracilimonas sp.]|uniref:copper resistance protein NlpE n=1 Tax=Gracilimonas sp. TaxID=1974203 RepID=UPI0032ED0C52